MADDSTIWEYEEKFWTGHGPFHEETVPDETVMVFGDPVGITSGSDARAALDRAPDWVGVKMSDQQLIRPADGVAITAYHAEGDAGNGVIHKVYCSSTWVERDGTWLQVQHQQTPA